jgi:hypothetical protein
VYNIKTDLKEIAETMGGGLWIVLNGRLYLARAVLHPPLRVPQSRLFVTLLIILEVIYNIEIKQKM